MGDKRASGLPINGRVLEEKIYETGLDVSEFAKLVGVSASSVHNHIRGVNNPKRPVAYQYAKALDCRIDDLMKGRRKEDAPKSAAQSATDRVLELFPDAGGASNDPIWVAAVSLLDRSPTEKIARYLSDRITREARGV